MITESTITVSWSQNPTDTVDGSVVVSDFNGPHTGMAELADVHLLGSSVRSFVLADLRQGSPYFIRIAVLNGAGFSSFTEVDFSTAPGKNAASVAFGQILCYVRTHL